MHFSRHFVTISATCTWLYGLPWERTWEWVVLWLILQACRVLMADNIQNQQEVQVVKRGLPHSQTLGTRPGECVCRIPPASFFLVECSKTHVRNGCCICSHPPVQRDLSGRAPLGDTTLVISLPRGTNN